MAVTKTSGSYPTMSIYWVLLVLFHMTVLIHTGNSCTVQITSDADFVVFGGTAHLNCTSSCKDPSWETRLTKLSTSSSDNFASVIVKVSEWEDSPIFCLTDLDGKDYKAVHRVHPYVLPSRVDIALQEELEEDIEHKITCSANGVAPVQHAILSVTRGKEIFLSKTYTEDPRIGPQDLMETFEFKARRSDNLQDFACQVTLNLTRVPDTTVQSPPVTVRTFALPESPKITAETWVEQGSVTDISCEVLHAFPPENVTMDLSIGIYYQNLVKRNVVHFSGLNTSDISPAQYDVTCVAELFGSSRQSRQYMYIYEPPQMVLNVSRKVVNLGDTLKADCSLTQGNAEYFGLSLYADGALISSDQSPNLAVAVDTGARKPNISVTCELFIKENKKVLLTSEETITVLYAPEFSDASCPDSIIWVEDRGRKFGCESTGNPTPEEHCSFNSFTLQTSTFFTAERNMSGVYTCQASNSRGNVTKSVEVTVQYPPGTPTVNILTTSISTGGFVNLTCHSDALPSPTYKWTIPPHAQVALSQDNRSITIREASSSHNGSYTCHAKNDHGESSAYQNLEVKGDNIIFWAIIGVIAIVLVAFLIGLSVCYALKNGKKGFYDLVKRTQRNIPSSEVPLQENSSV